jgi:hypothetical protein
MAKSQEHDFAVFSVCPFEIPWSASPKLFFLILPARMAQPSDRIRQSWFELSQANDKTKEIEELARRYPNILNIQDRVSSLTISF